MTMRNWAKHFQAVSSGRHTADFGTIAGSYTIQELRDIIKSKDDELAALTKDGHADPKTPASWMKDLQALQSDYNAAKALAQDAIDKAGSWTTNLLVPDGYNTSGDGPYRRLMTVLNPGWLSHDASTDRISLLRQRLTSAGIKQAPYTVYQPERGNDPSSTFLRYTDPLAKGVEATGRAVEGALHSAEDAAGKVAGFTKPLLYALLALATVLGIFAIKTAAPMARAYLPPAPHRDPEPHS